MPGVSHTVVFGLKPHEPLADLWQRMRRTRVKSKERGYYFLTVLQSGTFVSSRRVAKTPVGYGGVTKLVFDADMLNFARDFVIIFSRERHQQTDVSLEGRLYRQGRELSVGLELASVMVSSLAKIRNEQVDAFSSCDVNNALHVILSC